MIEQLGANSQKNKQERKLVLGYATICDNPFQLATSRAMFSWLTNCSFDRFFYKHWCCWYLFFCNVGETIN